MPDHEPAADLRHRDGGGPGCAGRRRRAGLLAVLVAGALLVAAPAAADVEPLPVGTHDDY